MKQTHSKPKREGPKEFIIDMITENGILESLFLVVGLTFCIIVGLPLWILIGINEWSKSWFSNTHSKEEEEE